MRSYQQFFCDSEMSSQLEEPTTPGKGGALNVKTLKPVMCLSVIKLILAVLLLVFLSVLWAEGFSRSFEAFLTACGLMVVLPLSGATGLVATKKKCPCWMRFFLALCILSALFSFAVLIVFATELNAVYSDEYYFEQFGRNDDQRGPVLTMFVLLLLCVMADTVIAVVASALSCHALCQCCEGDSDQQNLWDIKKVPIPTLQASGKALFVTIIDAWIYCRFVPRGCVLATEMVKVDPQGREKTGDIDMLYVTHPRDADANIIVNNTGFLVEQTQQRYDNNVGIAP